MNSRDISLILVLVATTLYQFLLAFLNDYSSVFIKAIFTLFLWLATWYMLVNTFKFYNKFKLDFDALGFFLIKSLLILNFFNILRGIFDVDVKFLTSIGNPYNALALFTPLAVFFGFNKDSLYIINRYIYIVTIFGGIMTIFFLFILGGDNEVGKKIAWSLLSPFIFLIGVAPYVRFSKKNSIYGLSFFYLWYFGILIGSRAAIIKVSLIIIFIYISRLPIKLIEKFIFPCITTLLVIFIYFTIVNAYSNTESIFELATIEIKKLSDNTNDADILNKADSRTFLYSEVMQDLQQNESFLFGKGGSGTYFSSYFTQAGGDASVRLTVEVGFLAYLLKGGIISAILNIFLISYASILAIYKSNSRYAKWVGFMLLTHLFMLFSENLIAFDVYNLCSWVFVGLCLSNKFLKMNDEQIGVILNLKKLKLG